MRIPYSRRYSVKSSISHESVYLCAKISTSMLLFVILFCYYFVIFPLFRPYRASKSPGRYPGLSASNINFHRPGKPKEDTASVCLLLLHSAGHQCISEQPHKYRKSRIVRRKLILQKIRIEIEIVIGELLNGIVVNVGN